MHRFGASLRSLEHKVTDQQHHPQQEHQRVIANIARLYLPHPGAEPGHQTSDAVDEAVTDPPELDSMVPRRRCRRLPIRCEGDADNPIGVSLNDPQEWAGRDDLPIGCEGNVGDQTGVTNDCSDRGQNRGTRSRHTSARASRRSSGRGRGDASPAPYDRAQSVSWFVGRSGDRPSLQACQRCNPLYYVACLEPARPTATTVLRGRGTRCSVSGNHAYPGVGEFGSPTPCAAGLWRLVMARVSARISRLMHILLGFLLEGFLAAWRAEVVGRALVLRRSSGLLLVHLHAAAYHYPERLCRPMSWYD